MPNAKLRAAAVALAALVALLAVTPSAGASQVSAAGALSAPRSHAAAVLLGDGDVLMIGGQSASGVPLADCELYDPGSGTWSPTAPLPVPLSDAAATVLTDGQVLVAGGLTEAGGKTVVSATSVRYDPSTGAWTVTGSLHSPSYGASAAVVGSSGAVLYAGGLTGAGTTAGATGAAELYNAATGTWAVTVSMPLGVADAQSVPLAGGGVLVAGGESGSPGAVTGLAEIYGHGTWTQVESLPVPVAAGAVSLLSNGDVLVAGGRTTPRGSPTAVTQLFDPGTGHWLTMGRLPVASYGATATLLASGDVLYAGGLAGPSGTPSATTALFDPARGTWTASASLLLGRAFQTATRLLDGSVLLASGQTVAGVTGESERYQSGNSPTFTSAASVTFRSGSPASFTVTATGLPVPTLSESGPLPQGLSFRDNGNGTATIAGTPATGASGTSIVSITATNGVGAPVTEHLSIVLVSPPPAAPAITSPAEVAVLPGKPSTFTVTTSGFPPPVFSEYGSLPPGFSFHPNGNGTATLSGSAPTAMKAAYHLTVVVDNGVGAAAVQHLTIAPAAPAEIVSADRLALRAGSPGKFTVSARGWPTPSIALSGALPAGLSFHPGTNGTATISGTPTPRTAGTYAVTLEASNGVGSPALQKLAVVVSPPAPASSPVGLGYWYSTSTGQVVEKGAAHLLAPTTPQHPRDVTAMAATASGSGYYLVSGSGGVFNYGDARFYGSLAGRHLRSATIAIAPTPTDGGYDLVTRAGNVFNYGDARFYGSTARRGLPAIVAFALTPDARGYWLVSGHGNVYAFGDARFFGSPARLRLPPVVAFAPTGDGGGYYVVTAKGGVLAYGAARGEGSLTRRAPPVVAFSPTRDGRGYWLVTRAGNVYDFGDARFFGSSAHDRLPGPVTGFAVDF